jgi:hypothetical protein
LDVQRTIEASVEKKQRTIFGPPVGKRLIIFVDDMNMPKVDNYATQQPIALLKLLVERGGMYDRGKDLNWKEFKDICKSHEYLLIIWMGLMVKINAIIKRFIGDLITRIMLRIHPVTHQISTFPSFRFELFQSHFIKHLKNEINVLLVSTQ